MKFGGIFDVETKRERLLEVESELEDPAIWNNPEKAQTLGKERVQLDAVVSSIDTISTSLADCGDLFDLALQEEDMATAEEVVNELAKLTTKIEQLEFQRMFAGEMDPNNAYMDVQSGSGGTEAQDWANMLLRMYL